MALQPMPKHWHDRAPWLAKQRRRDALRRYVRELSTQTYAGPVTVAADPDGAAHWRELGYAVGAFCEVEGCEREHSARGLCNAHVKRAYRASRRKSDA